MQDAVMKWRTVDCFMPHCWCAGDGGLMIVLCLTVIMDLQLFFAIFYFFAGGSSEASVLGHFCFFLCLGPWDSVLGCFPPVPPR